MNESKYDLLVKELQEEYNLVVESCEFCNYFTIHSSCGKCENDGYGNHSGLCDDRGYERGKYGYLCTTCMWESCKPCYSTRN